MRQSISLGMTLTEFYESTPRELFNFIRGASERKEFEVEQGWDYARHIMWASIASMSGDKAPKPTQLIRLKRDKNYRKELTPYENQELQKWNDEQDRLMNVKK